MKIFEVASNVLPALSLALMLTSILPSTVVAQDSDADLDEAQRLDTHGQQEWVRLDRSGRWAWGVERTTAVWHGADRYVWTVAIAPEPTSVESTMVEHVIVLYRFQCQDTGMEIEPLAAYAVGASGEKVPLLDLSAVQIPANDTVREGVCRLGGIRSRANLQPTTNNLRGFVEKVMRLETLWDEQWRRESRAQR